MKFIHMADVHFDMPLIALNANRELIKRRRSEMKKAFHDVIQFAKKESVDCIFLSGDLFELKYVEKSTIDYIISNFQLIPEIMIFITPGNHDPFTKNSPYDVEKWPENVVIFKSDYGMISCKDADIYGIGFENYEMDSNQVSEIQIEDESKINILITHGTLNGAGHKYHDMKEKDLKKFDYVALGHIHEKKIDDSRIIYPGSLLSCGFDEPGEHGFVYGQITKDACHITFQSLDYTAFQKIELEITALGNYHEALERLNLSDDFYEIKLTGTRHFDIIELIENIKEQNKNVCKIKDLTKLSYDFETIEKEDNLKGVFTKKILEEMPNLSEEEKMEMYRTIDYIYQLMKS